MASIRPRFVLTELKLDYREEKRSGRGWEEEEQWKHQKEKGTVKGGQKKKKKMGRRVATVGVKLGIVRNIGYVLDSFILSGC